jgi:DNA-binding NarL/FixJ family response regulator
VTERTFQDDLLEREAELSALERLTEAVAEGRGGMALIAGPAGIGKSRLLEESGRRAAASGATVLSARASELEREFPFGVVRQLFEPLLASAGDAAFGGGAEPARTVFEPIEDAAPDPSFAVLHGLYWMTLNLAADRPLVLAIDDLHWCDRPSLRFVAYLARRLIEIKVLVLATQRPAEPAADAVLMAEIAGDPGTTLLEPGPLTPAAATALVRTRLGADADDDFCAACHEATGGNPLLLRELLSALEAEGVRAEAASSDVVRELGPRAASRAVLLRLARLPGAAAPVAHARAVLGGSADLAAVAELAEVPEDEAARATAALVQAEILRPDADGGFVHPVVQGAVYEDIPPGERELQHARAARLLAEAGAPADQIASHLLASPRHGDAWVVDTLAAGARGALARGAPESAVSYLRRALEEPPADDKRLEVLFGLGLAEALTSGPDAAEHMRAAYDGWPDPVGRGELAALLAEVYLFTGRFADAAAVARGAQADLPGDQLDLRQRLQVARHLVAHFDASADPEAAEPLDPATVEGDGQGAKLLRAQAAFDQARFGAPADECVPPILALLLEPGFVESLHSGGSFALIIFMLALSDQPQALAVCDAALAEAHRRGSLFAACGAHIFRGWVLLQRGDLREAEDLLTTGFDEVESWGIEPGRSHGSAFLSDLYVERDDVASARRAFERAGVPDEPPRSSYLVWWLTSRVRLLLAEGRYEEALARAYDVRERFEGVIENPAFAPWRSQAAEALVQLDRRDEAAALAAEELELARRWGAPRTIGRALRVLGSALEPAQAITHLEEAVHLLEDSQARIEHARALAALGGALRRDRRPLDAREPLAQALDLAARCEAGALTEHVRAEIYATGARPRTDPLAGVAALTASERRVVDLASEGRSAHEIAEALYVTPKTIDAHLVSAYRKLGIHSRRELTGVLSEA